MAVVCLAIASSKHIWSCSITRDHGYNAVAVWSSTGNVPYTPTKEYKQYRDLKGGVFPVKGPIQVGLSPILLEPYSSDGENLVFRVKQARQIGLSPVQRPSSGRETVKA
jgi:hypothetical protein